MHHWLLEYTPQALTFEFLLRPHAYLDPGSGSYLIQLLIAGLLGGALMVRAFWGRIVGFFRGLFNRAEPIEDDEQEA